MVDISTWRCRIGTFTQRARKYCARFDTNNLGTSCCYFVSYVVSVDLLVIPCIVASFLVPSTFFKKALKIQSNYYSQIVSVLILSGDIETNPGPGPFGSNGGKVIIIIANHSKV